jgi:hypothetical protein
MTSRGREIGALAPAGHSASTLDHRPAAQGIATGARSTVIAPERMLVTPFPADLRRAEPRVVGPVPQTRRP